MTIKPMIRNNICMNAHPEGLRIEVANQASYVKGQPRIPGPKHVLIIGGSTGYGLASRIVAAYGSGAATLNVAFERPASGNRTATAGWYNTESFEAAARAEGLECYSFYGDAFADDMKEQVAALIKEKWGTVDLVIYSLASGVRVDPKTGEMYRSALKPVGAPFSAKTVETLTGLVKEVHSDPATEEEIAATVKVMGGEDWALWIERLLADNLLAPGAMTVAYSYIGPELIRRVYREGTIGKAKEHLEATAKELSRRLSALNGAAYVSVNKAVVTRASSVIPVVPLYGISLFKVMKDMGLHEGTIEQIYRLFSDRLYSDGPVPTDDEQRIRIDDWEMRDDVQAAVLKVFEAATDENLRETTDIDNYHRDFLKIHGFGVDGVDYEKEIEP
jgi:enoyl-[acyl-carrier protein] reductase / trans-2-enoyl-CoA reductase (NAD+)